MLNENEQKFYNLGWLIGFIVGEGCFTSTRTKLGNLTFAIAITQKELEPLLKSKEILLEWGIKESSISIHNKERGRDINELRLNYSAFSDLMRLMDSVPIYSSKRDNEIRKFKQLWDAHISEKLLKQLAILEKIKNE